MRLMSTTPEASRSLTLTLADRAECDPRTAARALVEGPSTIRIRTVRARLEREMRALGVEPLAAREAPSR